MEKAMESLNSLLPTSRGHESQYIPVYEDDTSSEGDNGGERMPRPPKSTRLRLLQVLIGFIIYVLGMISAFAIARFNPFTTNSYLGSYCPFST